MQHLPDALEQEWLLSRLRSLIARQGPGQFVASPIVEPTKDFFPDRWESNVASLERVTRRLLQYAGLGHLGVDLVAFSGEAEPAADEGHAHRSTAGLFAGILDGRCRFAINERQSGDAESLAGVMAHEVAHAYRAHHKLAQTGQRFREEEELLTDLTTVYLGFGVLAVNNAHRYRSSGELRGAVSYTYWTSSKIGYLPAQAFSYLLAVQVCVREMDRDARRRLLRHLETNQSAYVKAALRELQEQEIDPTSRLGLPPRESWEEEKSLDQILQPLPLSKAVTDPAPGEPAAEEDRSFNAGRPTFRLTTSRQFLYAFWGAMAFAVVGLVLFAVLAESGWGFAFAVPGWLLGFFLGRRTRHDICSDPGCNATLEPEASLCPGCGGTISGRVRHANERLEREEQISTIRKRRPRRPRR